jgi:glycerol-3-phosphate O-acyltransferase
VLARYVDMATKAGVVQAVFPEGGLTRDGLLRPPKLGLLSYMVSGFDPNGPRDVVFIPVGINYDRVLEDRILTAAADTAPGETPRFRFNPVVFTGFVLKNLWLLVRGEWHRYGYACVSFGAPVSLRSHLSASRTDLRTLSPERRQGEIERLGLTLMDAVGRVVPALPVSIVAAVMLENGEKPLNAFELKGRTFALMTALEDAGAYVHIPRHDREYAIDVGLRMLCQRHIVKKADGLYSANPSEMMLLGYYANAIRHHRAPNPAPDIAPGLKTDQA